MLKAINERKKNNRKQLTTTTEFGQPSKECCRVILVCERPTLPTFDSGV